VLEALGPWLAHSWSKPGSAIREGWRGRHGGLTRYMHRKKTGSKSAWLHRVFETELAREALVDPHGNFM